MRVLTLVSPHYPRGYPKRSSGWKLAPEAIRSDLVRSRPWAAVNSLAGRARLAQTAPPLGIQQGDLGLSSLGSMDPRLRLGRFPRRAPRVRLASVEEPASALPTSRREEKAPRQATSPTAPIRPEPSSRAPNEPSDSARSPRSIPRPDACRHGRSETSGHGHRP